MNTLEAIASRRSIRHFESRPIPREDIKRILTAAVQAPSAKAMLAAPVTIVVINAHPPAEVPEQFHDDWNYVMLQSTGAAIEHLLLAATDLGIGSLWICDVLFARDEVLEWLGYPDDTLVAAVTLGYVSGEIPGPRPRRPWQEVTEWPSGG
ncbi:MAG: nitroreductase family protein [Anaerolineae bacterium]